MPHALNLVPESLNQKTALLVFNGNAEWGSNVVQFLSCGLPAALRMCHSRSIARREVYDCCC